MHARNSALVGLLACSAVFARPQGNPADVSELQWGACPETMDLAAEVPYECSTLTVPLDYSDPNDIRTTELQLLRVKALKQPALGAILMNPGGPGAVGTQWVAGAAPQLQTILEGAYDIIGFDPRGTGNTLPYACNLTSLEEAKKVKRQEIPDLDEPTPPEDYGDLAIDPDEIGMAQVLELLQERLDGSVDIAELCAAENDEYGEMIGTAFVARDMLAIVDALKQGKLLNYWGISYGTVLGGTFAAMFPDRVGHMLLESNVNLNEYMAGVNLEARVNLDDNVDGMFEKCIEASDKCILAEEGQTFESLVQNYENLLDALDQQTIETPEGEIDGGDVREFVLGNLYDPNDWDVITEGLHALYNGDWDQFLNLSAPAESSEYNKGTESILGIKCGDSRLRVENITDVEGLIEKQVNITHWFPLQPTLESIACTAWKVDAKERYEGDFQVTTQTPILVLNNAYDNITPLVSARNTSAGFSNSALLVQNSYGHVPEYTPSLCTVQAIRDYFLTGNLPKAGTVCEQEVPAFEEQDWRTLYEDLTSKLTKREYTRDEITTLRAVQSLGEKLRRVQ